VPEQDPKSEARGAALAQMVCTLGPAALFGYVAVADARKAQAGGDWALAAGAGLIAAVFLRLWWRT
jgi:hypothetical protein